MNVTLRQLSYFVALAEQGAFGRAAESVSVSQPALSVQIRELESQLGVLLVERLPRETRLTRAGQEVLERARQILGEVEELGHVARRQQGLSGRLHLGVIPTVAPYFLPRALPLLRAQDVALDLKVREAQTHTLIGDLLSGRLDAAVIALPSGHEGLEEIALFRDRFLLAGSPAQLAELRAGGSIKPGELAPERLLLLDEGHCLADQALAACAVERAATRVDLGASSLGTLCGLVSEGFGMTFLPEIAVESETASAPQMALMPFAAPEPFRTIGLVRRHRAADGDWFETLSAVLRQAGAELVDRARPFCDSLMPQTAGPSAIPGYNPGQIS